MLESDPETGTETFYPILWLGEAGLSPAAKSFIWKAGDDAPNINTSDAKIRIIAFYPKMLEDGVTQKPMSEQTSGWNGEGNFGGSGGSPGSNDPSSPDGDGTSPSGDVYVRDYADTNSYYVAADPGYATLFERIQSQYGLSPIAPAGYFDDASQLHHDVFQLSDGIVMELTGMNPPAGMLLCATVDDNLIPVMAQ